MDADHSVLRQLRKKRFQGGGTQQNLALCLTVARSKDPIALAALIENVLLFGKHQLKKRSEAMLCILKAMQLRLDERIDRPAAAEIVVPHVFSISANTKNSDCQKSP